MSDQKPNLINIKKIEKDGTIKRITVDFNKLPCAKCNFYGHFCCPHCDWNKDCKYIVY